MNLLDSLLGTEVPLVAKMLIAFGVIFGLLAILWFIGRRFLPGPRVGGAAGRNRQPRLGVLDAHAVDARRKLVLIRRDNVEHLIMIGGPNDVVIESTILRGRPQGRASTPAGGPGERPVPAPVPLPERDMSAPPVAERRPAPPPPPPPPPRLSEPMVDELQERPPPRPTWTEARGAPRSEPEASRPERPPTRASLGERREAAPQPGERVTHGYTPTPTPPPPSPPPERSAVTARERVERLASERRQGAAAAARVSAPTSRATAPPPRAEAPPPRVELPPPVIEEPAPPPPIPVPEPEPEPEFKPAPANVRSSGLASRLDEALGRSSEPAPKFVAPAAAAAAATVATATAAALANEATTEQRPAIDTDELEASLFAEEIVAETPPVASPPPVEPVDLLEPVDPPTQAETPFFEPMPPTAETVIEELTETVEVLPPASPPPVIALPEQPPAVAEPPPPPPPKPKPDPTPDPFASLEEEMASLLGRIPGASKP